MMKRNAIARTLVASAVLAMVGVANAGSLSAANTVFATENFLSSNTAGVALTSVGAVNYSTSSSLTVNPSTHLYFVIRLTGGTFTAAPVFGDFKLAGTTAAAAAGAAVPGVAITLSADKTTALVDFTTQTGATTLLGLGAMTYTPSAGGITGDATVLSTAGSTITATATLQLTAPTAASLESTVALPTSVDAPNASAAIATSTKAITSAVSALSTYTGKIDLTANPTASGYKDTAGTVLANVALGSVTFTNTAGAQGQAGASGNDYTVVLGSANTAPTNVKIDVTPGTGQVFPVGATLFADITSSGCAAAIGGTTTAAFTSTTNSAKTTITVPTGSLTTGTPIFVCMSAPSAGNTASPITASLTGTITSAVATDAKPAVTGNGYALGYNGSQTDVRSYVPAATSGYKSYVRVINTGSVTAAVSATPISAAGVTGNAGTLGTLAAGASATYDSTAIEAALTAAGNAAFSASERPRIRISAPTNSMSVQSFFLNPDNSFSTLHGQD